MTDDWLAKAVADDAKRIKHQQKRSRNIGLLSAAIAVFLVVLALRMLPPTTPKSSANISSGAVEGVAYTPSPSPSPIETPLATIGSLPKFDTSTPVPVPTGSYHTGLLTPNSFTPVPTYGPAPTWAPTPLPQCAHTSQIANLKSEIVDEQHTYAMQGTYGATASAMQSMQNDITQKQSQLASYQAQPGCQ